MSVRNENLLFSESKVLLSGGISMKITGQLTYCIDDPMRFVNTLDRQNYLRTIENMIEAEFATVREQKKKKKNAHTQNKPLVRVRVYGWAMGKYQIRLFCFIGLFWCSTLQKFT